MSPCLDLQRCLEAFRAAEFSKERSKTLEEGEIVNSLRDQMKRGKGFHNKGARRWMKREKVSKGVKSRRTTGSENESPVHDAHRKETRRCKYCGGKHLNDKQNCPAFGKKCSAYRIMNHFVFKYMAKAKVNVVETESESDVEYCLTLESMDEGDIFSVHAASEYARKLFATINVENSTARFQLDSGATCNLLPAKYLEDGNELTPTRKWFTMYNDTITKPLGMCTMEVLPCGFFFCRQ